MSMRIIPNDSVELVEKLLIMARNKLSKIDTLDSPAVLEMDEIDKLLLQSINILNSTDNS